MGMSALDCHNSSTAPIAPELVISQLDAILASETFKNSSRLSRFLRYVVEQALEGNTGLKERKIAVDVFDRDSDYDPRADPVVRVEARQLRFKLAEYYSKAGDDILISLPKGGYAPIFERRLGVGAESSGNIVEHSAPTTSGNTGKTPTPELGRTARKDANGRARSKRSSLIAFALGGAMLLALAYLPIGKARQMGRQAHRTNPEAHDLYLKGRYYWNKRTPAALSQAIDYFTQAVVRDPAYAQAYVGLADCYNLLSEFSSMPPRDAFARASAAAKRAVELDDSSAEAHNALAFSSFWGMWSIATAEREFERALALNPNYVQAHHWYATYLLALGRVGESLAEIQRARELDPLSTAILADKGLILFYAGRKDEAIGLLKQLEVAEPEFLSSHRYLRDIALIEKDYRAYVSEARQTANLSNDAGALAIAEAAQKGFSKGGEQAMFQNILLTEKGLYAQGRLPAYSLAQTCALMRDKNAALGYLTRAYEKRENGMIALRIDFLLGSLHADAGYGELLKKVGLPPLS
jgi:tetratricopeptide (TPR) repeat protein